MVTSEKHLIVTGASGFVGQAVIHSLREQGHHITALSHCLCPKLTKASSVATELDWVVGDIRRPKTWDDMPSTADIFIHLASQISKDTTIPKVRASLFETNVVGTWRALQYCSKKAIPRFIFASTHAVYGKPTCVPILETDTLAPETLHSATQVGAEALVARYTDLFPLGSSVILRLGAVYGPGLRRNVIRIFLDCASRGEPLRVVNGGLDAYDFVYIDDVVQAISLAVFSQEQGTFNIGSGHVSTILDIARAMKCVMPQVELNIHPYTKAPRHFVMAINHAAHLLGYKPKVGLREGIRITCREEALWRNKQTT
jgi:UDP-glucose 4-epimerase